ALGVGDAVARCRARQGQLIEALVHQLCVGDGYLVAHQCRGLANTELLVAVVDPVSGQDIEVLGQRVVVASDGDSDAGRKFASLENHTRFGDACGLVRVGDSSCCGTEPSLSVEVKQVERRIVHGERLDCVVVGRERQRGLMVC
ncbi:MAG: hypothetical protein F083_2490, partial [bacterium F083]